MHSANSSQRKIFPEDNNMSYPNANDHPAWDSPQQAYNNTDLEKGENTHMHPVGRRPSSAGSARSASSRGSAATYQSSNFEHPENAVEIDPKHKRAVKVFGKVGFVAKAIIYGVLGGLLIRVAAGGQEDSSPQGVFVVMGDNAVGIPILVVLAISLVFYIIWRFWEAVEGQGSDAEFSGVKNFFRFRISPFVSGAVYTAYTYYVIRTLLISRPDRDAENGSQTTRSSFPDSWSSQGGAGKLGVCVIGIAFSIATLIQFKVAITGSFRRELYQNKLTNRWLRWVVHGLGRVGFFARGLLFLLVAILMFRSAANDNDPTAKDNNHSITRKAVDDLQFKWWGKAILILLGIGLLLYALFALLNAYYKIFPTPPPSRKPAISDDGDEEGDGAKEPKNASDSNTRND